MFIRVTDNNGIKYLSVAKKVKSPDGEWKVKYVTSIGSLKKLKAAFKNPKEFFGNLLDKIVASVEEWRSAPIPKKDDSSKRNLGSVYIRWVLGQMGLREYFGRLQSDYKVGFDLFEIFCLLVEAQIIDPSSFRHTVENELEYVIGTDIPLWDVYRALDIFADHSEEIQAVVYSHLEYDKDRERYLYADGTNVYFESDLGDEPVLNEKGEIEAKPFRSKGFSKENRPLPLVNLELLGYSDGMPIAFCLFPGCESEKTQLVPLLNQVRTDYNLYDFTVSADRAYHTGNVIAGILAVDKRLDFHAESYILGLPIRQADAGLKKWALSQADYRYILLSSESGKKGTGHLKYKYRRLEKFYSFGDNDGKKESFGTEQAQLIYYSPIYDRREKRKREKKIKKAEEMIKKPGGYNAAKNSGAASFVQEAHFVQETGEMATERMLSLNEAKIKEQEALDGLYVIVTNDLALMPLRIRYVYRKLTYLEDDFRNLKSVLKLRPVYVRTPAHILAHFLIAIVSLQVLQVMRDLFKDLFTIPEIAGQLRDFNCYRLSGDKYVIPYDNDIIQLLSGISGLGFSKREVSLSEIKKEKNKPGNYVTIRVS